MHYNRLSVILVVTALLIYSSNGQNDNLSASSELSASTTSNEPSDNMEIRVEPPSAQSSSMDTLDGGEVTFNGWTEANSFSNITAGKASLEMVGFEINSARLQGGSGTPRKYAVSTSWSGRCYFNFKQPVEGFSLSVKNLKYLKVKIWNELNELTYGFDQTDLRERMQPFDAYVSNRAVSLSFSVVDRSPFGRIKRVELITERGNRFEVDRFGVRYDAGLKGLGLGVSFAPASTVIRDNSNRKMITFDELKQQPSGENEYSHLPYVVRVEDKTITIRGFRVRPTDDLDGVGLNGSYALTTSSDEFLSVECVPPAERIDVSLQRMPMSLRGTVYGPSVHGSRSIKKGQQAIDYRFGYLDVQDLINGDLGFIVNPKTNHKTDEYEEYAKLTVYNKKKQNSISKFTLSCSGSDKLRADDFEVEWAPPS